MVKFETWIDVYFEEEYEVKESRLGLGKKTYKKRWVKWNFGRPFASEEDAQAAINRYLKHMKGLGRVKMVRVKLTREDISPAGALTLPAAPLMSPRPQNPDSRIQVLETIKQYIEVMRWVEGWLNEQPEDLRQYLLARPDLVKHYMVLYRAIPDASGKFLVQGEANS